MRIVIITQYWLGSQGGGIRTHLMNLVSQLKKNHFDVKVIFKEGSDDENYKISDNRFLFPLKALMILRKIKPDVVHSQDMWYCLLGGFLYKKLHGVKLVHTFRTEPQGKLSFFSRTLLQFLINSTDSTTFVSKDLKMKIETMYGLSFKKTYITYAGVVPKTVTEEQIKDFRRTYDLPDGSRILLANGLTALKCKANGMKVLMQALKELNRDYPNLILISTRDGIYTDELKATAQSLLLSNIVFTGYLDNVYIPLEICDIYTHITFCEGGVSNSILEAMSMGKAVIATNVGGIPELIVNGENGLLVEPAADSAIKGIRQLLENDALRQTLGENAGGTVSDHWTWERSVEGYIRSYNG